MVANDWDEDLSKKYFASNLTGDAFYVLAVEKYGNVLLMSYVRR